MRLNLNATLKLKRMLAKVDKYSFSHSLTKAALRIHLKEQGASAVNTTLRLTRHMSERVHQCSPFIDSWRGGREDKRGWTWTQIKREKDGLNVPVALSLFLFLCELSSHPRILSRTGVARVIHCCRFRDRSHRRWAKCTQRGSGRDGQVCENRVTPVIVVIARATLISSHGEEERQWKASPLTGHLRGARGEQCASYDSWHWRETCGRLRVLLSVSPSFTKVEEWATEVAIVVTPYHFFGEREWQKLARSRI